MPGALFKCHLQPRGIVIYLLQFLTVQALVFVLNLLPLELSGRIAKCAGRLFYTFAAGRRKIALGNLARAYGDTLSREQKKAIVRGSFENTAQSILDLFLIKKIRKHAARNFTIKGKENMDAALAQGKGVILITSHLGSWECLEFLFYLTGIPCSVIVKSLKNKYLDKSIDGLRRATTVIPIPKKNAIRGALTELQANHVVAVLIDQWDGKDGLWIDFFGTPTATTSLPARLAKKTDCALIPAYCLRKGVGRYEILVLPQVQLPRGEADWETSVTRRLNEMLESHIREYPEQWSWAHRRWKPKPETSRQP